MFFHQVASDVVRRRPQTIRAVSPSQRVLALLRDEGGRGLRHRVRVESHPVSARPAGDRVGPRPRRGAAAAPYHEPLRDARKTAGALLPPGNGDFAEIARDHVRARPRTGLLPSRLEAQGPAAERLPLALAPEKNRLQLGGDGRLLRLLSRLVLGRTAACRSSPVANVVLVSAVMLRWSCSGIIVTVVDEIDVTPATVGDLAAVLAAGSPVVYLLLRFSRLHSGRANLHHLLGF